jgi:hypothetical protein
LATCAIGKSGRKGDGGDGYDYTGDGLAFTMANQPRYGGRWEECVDYIRWVYTKEGGKREPEANGTIF